MLFRSKGARQRRLHKAILRYHDPAGWPMIREALRNMGKANLIGGGPNCLVPDETRQEKAQRGKKGTGHGQQARKGGKPALTRHTGFSQFKKANTKPRVGVNKQRANKPK